MRAVLDAEPGLENLHPTGWAPRWPDRPVTRFEQRGLDAGRRVHDLTYRRRPGGPAVSGTRRWRLDLAYDGTDFAGWARQPGLRTVQGELETWVTQVLRLPAPVALVCAGRTDTGVHARGQVAHVDLPAEALPADGSTGSGATLTRRLHRVLPPDLVVRSVRPAPEGFDARFAALWRRYVYRLSDGGAPLDPLHRGWSPRCPRPWTSGRSRRPRPRCSGCATSARSAAAGRGRRPSGPCSS